MLELVLEFVQFIVLALVLVLLVVLELELALVPAPEFVLIVALVWLSVMLVAADRLLLLSLVL